MPYWKLDFQTEKDRIKVDRFSESIISPGLTKREIQITDGVTQKKLEHLHMVSWQDDSAVVQECLSTLDYLV